ncbi:MAG: SH3 domain-containing protein [Treponema sp.]|jgi:hypothetical protein|nr:SH3 domain-containing protein [Treponema sp.]
MKNTTVLITVLSLLLAFGLHAQSQQGKIMYVAVKEAAVKASSGAFAEDAGVFSFGDSVQVIQEKGKWVEVQAHNNTRTPNLKGWVAAGSLSSRRVVAGNRSASTGELALAGKGFSPEVERAYSRGEKLDYRDIDAMEAVNIPGKELLRFLTEGHLSLGD